MIRHPHYTIEKVVPGVEPHTPHYFSARISIPETQPVAEGRLNVRGSPAMFRDRKLANRANTSNVPDIVLTPGQWNYVSCIVPGHRDPTDHVILRLVFKLSEPGDVAYIDDITVVPIRGAQEE